MGRYKDMYKDTLWRAGKREKHAYTKGNHVFLVGLDSNFPWTVYDSLRLEPGMGLLGPFNGQLWRPGWTEASTGLSGCTPPSLAALQRPPTEKRGASPRARMHQGWAGAARRPCPRPGTRVLLRVLRVLWVVLLLPPRWQSLAQQQCSGCH